MAAIELEEAREEDVPASPPPRTDAVAEDESDALINPPPPPPVEDDDGSCGGWWRSRNRAPEGVRKAEMWAAVGGYVSMCLRYLSFIIYR